MKTTRSKRRREARREALVSILPNLLTLGNVACGFGAIVYAAGITATVPVPGADGPPLHAAGTVGAVLGHPNLFLASVLVLVGMVFDVIDGRVARLTHSTSDLGAQLDSLADAITFGLAPAFLAWRLAILVPKGVPGHLPTKVVAVLAVIYLCCAVLRLARYNVETQPEDKHDAFQGLPTPGAAGVVASILLLGHEEIENLSPGFCVALAYVLPAVVVGCGLAMVSRVPYVHFLSWLLRGKKPFAWLVGIVFGVAFVAVYPSSALALGFCGYAALGPAMLAWRRVRGAATGSATPPGPAPAPDFLA